jgi:hypothetical protein
MLRAVGQYPLSALYNTVTVAVGSAVSLTTATPANITSKSLVAGTYLVWGIVDFNLTAVTATEFRCGPSLTTGTLPTQPGGAGLGTDALDILPLAPAVTTDVMVLMGGPTLLILAATTTLFLVAQATFSAGTVTGFGTLNALQINVA